MSDHFPEPIRVLSDIHWRHPISLVRRPEQLNPLFAGVGTVVFNGDTVEQQRNGGAAAAREDAEVFAALCRKAGAVPVFVSGNHDPEVSDRPSLRLGEDRVLVTHGDVLFPEISVWAGSQPELRARCEGLFRNGFAPSADGLDAIVGDVRTACTDWIERRRGRLKADFRSFLLRQGCPPTRALTILRCWWESRDRGVGLAERHAEETRLVVFGHSHFPGTWSRGNRLVVNTGSFFPLMGRSLVDIEQGRVTVRHIVRRNDAFHPGAVRRSWVLSDP